MEWRQCVDEDREALTRFECTTRPEKSAATNWRPQHPRIWEYQVQSAIRDLRPPYRTAAERVYLLVDHGTIVAVCHLVELDGPAVVEIYEVAVALHRRGQGLGALALSNILDDIVDRALSEGVEEVLVQGMIWHENTESIALAKSLRLAHVGHGAPGVQQWQLRMLVGGVELLD